MNRHLAIAYAAQYVMSINYELWQQFNLHRLPKVRRLGLMAKTRALIAYDQVIVKAGK